MSNNKDLETIIQYIHKDLHECKTRIDKLIKEYKKNDKEWSKIYKQIKGEREQLIGLICKLNCSCSNDTLDPKCKIHQKKIKAK